MEHEKFLNSRDGGNEEDWEEKMAQEIEEKVKNYFKSEKDFDFFGQWLEKNYSF